MNSSIDGTSSPTSFNIVLYCDNNLVHAGEYLLQQKQCAWCSADIQLSMPRLDSLNGRYGVTDIGAF